MDCVMPAGHRIRRISATALVCAAAITLSTSDARTQTNTGEIDGVGAMAESRALSHFLFAADGADLTVIAAVSGALGLCAVAACLIPIRRALRADPLVALRAE
jgi:ABC-type antimicrobial peptide transport system permease subunit